jgi:voltage-dependent potassium channel beta subunit
VIEGLNGRTTVTARRRRSLEFPRAADEPPADDPKLARGARLHRSRLNRREEFKEYRRVGATGLKISAVSIGGWINFGGTIGEDAARSVVRAAVDHGVNFIDLADVYARGEAERVVGRMLADYDRSKLVLSSKVFWPMSDDPNDRGLGRKHIMESVERSLKNLRTEYLDLYFCHREDPEVPLEETARAMDDLVHQGKILYWGTSVWPAASIEAAHRLADERGIYAPMVEQPQYSLLDRSIEESVMPTAKRLGVGLVVWSPLAGGMLTGKYDQGIPANSRAAKTNWLETKLNERNFDRVRRFMALARELGQESGQLALAWILQREEISCVITGATHAEQVLNNVRAVDLHLDAEVTRRLEQIFPAA